ncbi:N-acylneuraminate-9-phosphatase [Nymphaea thermarum]|nr:N-acylneuraminate-9-phosphatase [Nymphaea thermarum]
MVVKAVLFDLDDTLVSTDATNQAACSRAVELLHSRYPTVRGQDVADSFWRAFIPQPWDPHNQIDVTEWRAQLWHKALQEQGIDDIALARVQRDKLGAAEASKLFDVILVGGEEANEKPHPSIFIKACELVGSRPEESVMVGDNLKTDVQGARNANLLAAVWVNVHGIVDIPEDVTARPSYTIDNVIELPQVLSLIQ